MGRREVGEREREREREREGLIIILGGGEVWDDDLICWYKVN